MTTTATRSRGIIFSGEMVRAILEGRKTQTRRMMKPQPGYDTLNRLLWQFSPHHATTDQKWWLQHCPYGQVGDHLWVREVFYFDMLPWANGGSLKSVPGSERTADHLYYRADGECCRQIPECACAEVGKPKWRTGRFMPRWASRLTLEITDVRVERLQQISEDDALADGGWTYASCPFHKAPVKSFAHLWDSLNKSRGFGWQDNPWVWAVSFRRID